MSLFPDEPIGFVATGSTRSVRIHTDIENCPYAPDGYRETTEADLRNNARKCTWCDAHGGV